MSSLPSETSQFEGWFVICLFRNIRTSTCTGMWLKLVCIYRLRRWNKHTPLQTISLKRFDFSNTLFMPIFSCRPIRRNDHRLLGNTCSCTCIQTSRVFWCGTVRDRKLPIFKNYFVNPLIILSVGHTELLCNKCMVSIVCSRHD